MKFSLLAITSLTAALILAGCATEEEAAPAPAPVTATAAAPVVAPAAAPVTTPAVAPVTAPAAPAVKPAPAPAPKKISVTSKVFFKQGKVALSSEAKTVLDDLLTKLNGVKVIVIVTYGHTDNVGSAASKEKRGLAEASAVKDYLVAKGVVPNLVYTESKADAEPADTNKTGKGRANNRRVEIEAIGVQANK